ncbi:hypothetical protein AYI69_g2137 [Smittium culicis]|uniref:Uncharacterized protein n=1 Tax=Smittium culicis TaxID=133412 RepID=A0A1R1YNB1_9FUNG|nr:hypothetical protein AYI69_g2137 [Smittium culicis]
MNIIFDQADFSKPLLEVSKQILNHASVNNNPPFIILIDLIEYLERLVNELVLRENVPSNYGITDIQKIITSLFLIHSISTDDFLFGFDRTVPTNLVYSIASSSTDLNIGYLSAEKLSLEYQKPHKNEIHYDFNDAVNSKYLTDYAINHDLLADIDNSILNNCIDEAISSTISHFQPNLEHIQSNPLNDQPQEINDIPNSPLSKFSAQQHKNSDSNPKSSGADFLISTLDSAYGKSEISSYSLPFELQFETISRLQDIDSIDNIFEPYFDFSAQFIETCFELLKSIYAKFNLTESNKRVIQQVSLKNSSTLTHNRLVELLLSRTDKINTEIMHLYLASSESLCRNFNAKSLPQLHNSKLTCSLFTKFFKLGLIDTADFKAELSSFCLTYIWTKEAATLYSIVSEK